MNKKLSKEEKRDLFDKMCRDNHFLQAFTNSTYLEIRDQFINNMIDLDDLVSYIEVDGSANKSWDTVKKIVYDIFSD